MNKGIETIQHLVSEVFPGCTKEFAEDTLWTYTGYPCWFVLEPGQTIRDKIIEQLQETKERMEAGWNEDELFWGTRDKAKMRFVD